MTPCCLDHQQIKLVSASIADYPIVQNMARFYVYDMSEYMGTAAEWAMPEDGLYECIDFKKYWEDSTAFPFLIRYKDELAGFVIVDRKGSDAEVEFNMAQFFIIRKFKGKGLGRFIAELIFEKFKGIWEVMVMPNNTGAYGFWRSVIAAYTEEDYTEYARNVAHLSNSQKNIFRFESRSQATHRTAF